MVDLSPDKIVMIVQMLVTLILSVCVHEFGHAWVAAKLGDKTPVLQGRVTLNPLAHADPVGTVAFPLIGALFGGAGFGWGKPVMVHPPSFTKRFTMRTGHMFVALAGPAMNLIFAAFLIALAFALAQAGVIEPEIMSQAAGRGVYFDRTYPIETALVFGIYLNFILMIFNLIPAHPLDGGAVLEGLLPAKAVPKYRELSVYGPFVLMAFIFIEPLRVVIGWPAEQLMTLVSMMF